MQYVFSTSYIIETISCFAILVHLVVRCWMAMGSLHAVLDVLVSPSNASDRDHINPIFLSIEIPRIQV
jgi:hypothetical protein